MPLGMGNKVIMFEHAIYSVISPEGCASILWRSINHSERAAESLKLTAQDLLDLEVIDEINQENLLEERIETLKKHVNT